MTVHKLKLPEPYFSAVLSGEKTFDGRRPVLPIRDDLRYAKEATHRG